MGWYVGFDFDGCLHDRGDPVDDVIEIMRAVAAGGDMPLIVTARTASHEMPNWYGVHEPDRVLVWPFVIAHELPIHGVIFCEHQPKEGILFRMAIRDHYDNDATLIEKLNADPGSITRGHLVGVPRQ